MRFELFLVALPKAPTHKVQSALAELPKGASTGTVLKAMEERSIPTVSIAWSDDKRVLNEVLDTLVELGAEVKLVDHGSILEKLATFAAEKAGRARYLEDDDDPESRKYIKMKQGKRASTGEELTRHAIIYALQLCLTSVLFVWFVALRVGMERVFSTPELYPQLAACAVGLLVTYVCTASVRSVQTGRRSVPRILPQLILGGLLTIGALFFLGDGFDNEQVADGKVKRPPSLPYAGLLTELARRKADREISGEQDEAAAEQALAEAEEDELLWCERPETLEELSCAAGRAWEEALACLPKPEPPAKPQRAPERKRVVKSEEPTAELLEPMTEEVAAVERPWALSLGLSTVLTLSAMWLLSLLGLYLQLRPRAKRDAGHKVAPIDDLSEAPDEVGLEVSDALLSGAEHDALKRELGEAKAALAAALAETHGAPIADEEQFVNMQRELEQSRSSLGENQVTIADLKRELAQVREQLSQALEQREQLRTALMELRARRIDARADNDGGERSTGLTRQLAQQEPERNTGLTRQPPQQEHERNTGTSRQLPERNTGLTRQLPEEQEASYSSKQVQEERIQLGKRHKQ